VSLRVRVRGPGQVSEVRCLTCEFELFLSKNLIMLKTVFLFVKMCQIWPEARV